MCGHAQPPYRFARVAVKLVKERLRKADLEALPARHLHEGRVLGPPQRHATQGPGPLDTVRGRDHSQLQYAVVRFRLFERLDPTQQLAHVRHQHTGKLSLEEAVAVDHDASTDDRCVEVQCPRPEVSGGADTPFEPTARVPQHEGVEPRHLPSR
jgi:hypothetical protein